MAEDRSGLWNRMAPALLLAFLAPMFAEVLPGATRFSSIFVLPIELAVWGGGGVFGVLDVGPVVVAEEKAFAGWGDVEGGVVNLMRPGVERNLEWLQAQAPADRLRFVCGDVRDADLVQSVVGAARKV